jgi:GNAT superfamily N-acetyltransferase
VTPAYRTALLSDADAIAAMWNRADEIREGREGAVADLRGSVIADRLANPEGVGFVAVVDEALVGSALLQPATRQDGPGPDAGRILLGHLNTVAVAPGWWGRGIGSQLLELIVEFARAHDMVGVQLWTQLTNDRARALYERHDWVLARERMHDARGELLVRYVRTL